LPKAIFPQSLVCCDAASPRPSAYG